MSIRPEDLRVVALVPAWKAAAFIGPVLESLAAQTHPDLQVLISDDASPDRTADLCEEFAHCRASWRLIRQPRNLGWIGNTNALLQEADGDAFFFAFHDDVLDRRYVEKLAARLAADPGASLAYADLELVQTGGGSEAHTFAEQTGPPVERARAILRRRGDWWVANRGLFRAGAARHIGGLRRNFAGEFSADWPWMIHMAIRGRMLRVPEVLVTKHYTQQSVSRAWDFSLKQRLAVAAAAGREVRRAGLPLREELALQAEVARVVAGHLKRAARG